MSLSTLRSWIALGLATAASVAPLGCASAPRAPCRSSAVLQIAERSPEADALWKAAQDTLRSFDYALDRVDPQRGVITTIPVSSQHFFEFWRHDVATAHDYWEATVNPLRRRAEVTIVRNEAGDWTGIEVAVFKQRLSSLDRQVSSSGSIYQVFGDRLPATTGQPRVTSADDRWIDLGRDPAMEDRLLGLIMQQANLPRRVS